MIASLFTSERQAWKRPNRHIVRGHASCWCLGTIRPSKYIITLHYYLFIIRIALSTHYFVHNPYRPEHAAGEICYA
ncbi:hypothetical protein BDA96_04G090400 [Sorghum bicolor]|uniref:Uncharacterized protein n=1 Tax=Sorghum bicolor TaxID=4558 RepID=A0A921R1J0_SORBI|nr:hypothetical protein BDA96_04G090400 [Sorghum bicolor]